MKRFLYSAIGVTAASIGLFFGRPWPISSPPGTPPTVEKERERLKTACATFVKECEDQLAQEVKLQRAGSTGESEVDDARFALAEARRDLAQAESQREAVIEQSRVLVAIRERERDRLLTLPGGGDVGAVEVLAARRRLSNAREWLARDEDASEDVARYLREIIDVCEAELKAVEALVVRGSASSGDVDDCRRRLAYARYRLAREEGRTGEAVEQLHITVEARERDLKRKQQLCGSAAAAQDVDWHHVLLLEARQRLAVVEGNAPAAREHLGRIVAVLERTSQRLRDVFTSDRMLLAYSEYHLALAHYRLALASRDVALSEPDRLYELDK